jgi:hypothetical protein
MIACSASTVAGAASSSNYLTRLVAATLLLSVVQVFLKMVTIGIIDLQQRLNRAGQQIAPEQDTPPGAPTRLLI